MKNITLLMVAFLAAVAMLSVAVVVVPLQQASAQSTSFRFNQEQSNRCSGSAGCSNTGTITFTPPIVVDECLSADLARC